LIAPPPAAAGAGAEGDADDELAGLADAAADAAALTEVDADVDAAGVDVDPALAEPAWVWVVDRFCVGEGVDACELLLHAVAPKATTAMVATAARWLGRMIAPNFGRGLAPRYPQPTRRL
jgi:hypothetical protein